MDGAKGVLLVSILAGGAAIGCGGAGVGGAAGDTATPVDGASDVEFSGAAGSAGGASGDAALGDLAVEVSPGDQVIVLSLTPADGMAIAGVAAVVVTINVDGASRTQTFPNDPASSPIDDAGLVKVGIAVQPSQSGTVIFTVEARDAAGCTLAKGLANVLMTPDAIIAATVMLQRFDDCAAGDGGAADAGTRDATGPDGAPVFPGCNPAAVTCGDDKSCRLQCATKTAVCAAAPGAGFHGTTCAGDADCAPGSQCINTSDVGCAVGVCRRFCEEDAHCPQPLEAGLPRNACAVPFSCGSAATAHRACSVSCDPTFRARAEGDSVCPAQLDCLLLDPDHADCGCFPRVSVKTEGQACGPLDHCTSGTSCHAEGATSVCRSVCLCHVEEGACGAVVENGCPTAGTHCAPLTGGTVYGVCVP